MMIFVQGIWRRRRWIGRMGFSRPRPPEPKRPALFRPGNRCLIGTGVSRRCDEKHPAHRSALVHAEQIRQTPWHRDHLRYIRARGIDKRRYLIAGFPRRPW